MAGDWVVSAAAVCVVKLEKSIGTAGRLVLHIGSLRVDVNVIN